MGHLFAHDTYFSVIGVERKEGNRKTMYFLKRVITCPEGGECRETILTDVAENEEATLWITDSSVRGRELLAEGKAVLVWIHEGNRNQDFSAFRYACDNPQELDRDYLEGVFRRFRGIPWDILETERCLVRETTVEDVEEFYRIYREPSITEFMEPLYEEPERERNYARDYIDKVYGFYGFGIWTVLSKADEQVIGRAGICYREGYEDPEIGFLMAVDKQGLGYATEVCQSILQYGHEVLGFERILAFVQPANKASLRVCEKLGMSSLGETQLQGVAYRILGHEENR